MRSRGEKMLDSTRKGAEGQFKPPRPPKGVKNGAGSGAPKVGAGNRQSQRAKSQMDATSPRRSNRQAGKGVDEAEKVQVSYELYIYNDTSINLLYFHGLIQMFKLVIDLAH